MAARGAALSAAFAALPSAALAEPGVALAPLTSIAGVARLQAPPALGTMASSLAHVEPIGGFVQVEPVAGATPARRTELRMAHDGRFLYVQVRAFDPQPSGIVAQQMRRDIEGMLTEDQVTLVIDPDGQGRHGYLFAVNPNGAQFDALIFDGGQMRYDWDARWQSEARIDADGWQADIAIPLSVFGRGRTPTGDDMRRWRINVERWMPRGGERVRLAGIQPDKPVYSLGDALPMPAIVAERVDWGLRVKASLRGIGESSAASGTGRSNREIQPGVEVFHDSESGVRTTAALNIDFGEAEADERSVNLTRFELFRPEKREFFLQDAGRFSFGSLVESAVIPYYSRRIGLDATGRGRSLDGGLKFSGALGSTDFGLFGARIAGGPTEPGQPDQRSADVAVMRLAQMLGSRGRLGMMATRGNPEGTSGSSLWGVDYQFRETDWAWQAGTSGTPGEPPPRVATRKTLEANAWMLSSTNAGLGTGHAWGAKIDYPNVGLNGNAQFQSIDERFNPALGYLAESGVTRGEGQLGWWHRGAGGQNIIPAVDWNFRRRHDGTERSWLFNPEVEYSTANGDALMAEVAVEGDLLASAYELVPGVTVRPGSHSWRYVFAHLATSPSRPVSAIAELRAGTYYDGHRDDQSLQVAWHPTSRWGWQVGGARRDIRLPSGRFTVRTATLRLDHTPDTRMSQSVLLQWDNISAQLGISARLRWLWAPDKELIFALDRLGYTGERREVGPPDQTRAMLKLVWNFER